MAKWHDIIGEPTFADAILERIEAYRTVGVTKFVLIPLARGDDELMEQSRRLIEEVLPRVQGRAS